MARVPEAASEGVARREHLAGVPEPLFEKLRHLCEDSINASTPLDAGAVSALGFDFESAFSLRSQMRTRQVKRNTGRVRQEMPGFVSRWLQTDAATVPASSTSCPRSQPKPPELRQSGQKQRNVEEGEEVEEEAAAAAIAAAAAAETQIMAMAREARYPPYLFARILVELVLGCSKSRVGELCKNPALIAEDFARLRAGLVAARANDPDYSPASDQARRIVGLEYEYFLQRRLEARGVPFESEDELRVLGLAKTPDVRLRMPLGVRCPRTQKWHEVNWIDSKAMFGERAMWVAEHLPQMESYVHRYGPGLVVYWFGFQATLDCNEDICVLSDFPAELLFPGDDVDRFSMSALCTPEPSAALDSLLCAKNTSAVSSVK